MRKAILKDWAGVDWSVDAVPDATPPALLKYLLEADMWGMGAIAPYCGCGHLADSVGDAQVEDRYFGVALSPSGANHLRFTLAQSWDATTADPTGSTTHESWTNTGGMAGADIVTTAAPAANLGNPAGKFGGGSTALVDTGDTEDDAPTVTKDRLFEVSASLLPAIESCKTSKVGGFSVYTALMTENLELL